MLLTVTYEASFITDDSLWQVEETPGPPVPSPPCLGLKPACSSESTCGREGGREEGREGGREGGENTNRTKRIGAWILRSTTPKLVE